MGEATGDSILKKLGLRPCTVNSLARCYGPAFGVINYTMLSVRILNPNLVVRLLPEKYDTYGVIASALLGTGSYIYTCEHMKKARVPVRLVYSATGAMLLNFGSILAWAVLRSILPSRPALCTIAGIGGSALLIKISYDYLNFVDEQVKKG